jgi:hypothetical protein
MQRSENLSRPIHLCPRNYHAMTGPVMTTTMRNRVQKKERLHIVASYTVVKR